MAIKPVTRSGSITNGILRGTETNLLVADDEPLREPTERILKHPGCYVVILAKDGKDALVQAEQHANAVHLVLTDVIMPGMGGRELLERLLEKCPNYKILYMSGYTDTAIAAHGVLEAGTHLLGKPFTASNLTQKVREQLDAPKS